ncbi:unnamed protein product [Trichobilharzia szidati]|nr:unnamed protein product [Trichobilharzia szidati]
MCYRAPLFYTFCFCLFLIKSALTGQRDDDRIDFLPGVWPMPSFRQYSGYLHGSTSNIRLHYWLIEAKVNPKGSPLLLWLNGGPGCSSMEGLFSENGPYNVLEGIKVAQNIYSWNNFANVLYLEAPAGVGFSYAVDNNITTDDDFTALNNYHALLNFLKIFPEYMHRDFFLTGESYAGVYLPTLALHIIKSSKFKLKGIAVGNPLTSYKLNDNSMLYFAKYHGLIGEKVWNDLLSHCCHSKYYTRCMFTDNHSDKCQRLISYISDNVTSGLNEYNIYDRCGGVNSLTNEYLMNLYSMSDNSSYPGPLVHSDFGNHFRNNKYVQKKRELISQIREKIGAKLVLPCNDDDLIARYLDMPLVRKALHLRTDIPKNWEVCSDAVYAVYKRNYVDLSQQYKKIIESKVPILIYNGDIDMVCNFIGDEWFVDDLKLKPHDHRQSWIYLSEGGRNLVGGYWKSFVGNNVKFTFATVRGAGHMVPTDRPDAMYHLILSFVKNQSL